MLEFDVSFSFFLFKQFKVSKEKLQFSLGHKKLPRTFNHRKFQVPKIEVLNLIRLFWEWGFPYITLTYSLYRWVPPF